MINVFGLWRIFRALHRVKYSPCNHCGEPIPSESSIHTCNPKSLPLQFYYTKLAESARSIHFYDRCPGRSFLHEITVWAGNYIVGIEVTIEDLDLKTFKTFRHGDTNGKIYHFRLENGEFITDIDYGCDFHGMYYLNLASKHKQLTIGDVNRHKKTIEFPEGHGLVGIFGGHTDAVLHLGFYFDKIADVNWKRHRDLLLIKSRGKDVQDNDLALILKLDDSLIRYLAVFL